MRILLFVISLLVVGTLSAQDISTDAARNELKPILNLKSNYHDVFQARFDFYSDPFSIINQKQHILFHPGMLGYMHGMFCTAEYKMETKMKLAPKFRLGSVNYANWMEGKGEFYQRYWK